MHRQHLSARALFLSAQPLQNLALLNNLVSREQVPRNCVFSSAVGASLCFCYAASGRCVV